jgi:hypothetical protein
MTTTEIKQRLCTYDIRNPDNTIIDEWDVRTEPCYCDNCFYGRTKLAEELLKYLVD